MLMGSKPRDMHFDIIGRLFRRPRTLKKQPPINIEIGGAGVPGNLPVFDSGVCFAEPGLLRIIPYVKTDVDGLEKMSTSIH